MACPVIAVPTSIGYGASFNGSAALLAMLNSCAPGIAVVNVDNGSGAAALAHKIMNGSMRERARRIFRRMIEVEAGIHNIPVEQAHLHQLGALDTIADVVGVLLGFDLLGIQEIVVSPVPLGRGTLKTSHGQMPLPAPATVALLRGVPVVGVEHAIETVTPTAAALLTELASRFGPIPAMRLSAIGYGAGGRTTPVPNIVRILIGDAVESELIERETLVLLETNITALEAALIPVIEPILNPVWVFLFVGETPGRFALIGGADINRRRATSLK